jgi:hypothetical protein
VNGENRGRIEDGVARRENVKLDVALIMSKVSSSKLN